MYAPLQIQRPIPIDQWLKIGLNTLGRNLVPLLLISLVLMLLFFVSTLLILPLFFILGPVNYSMYAAGLKGVQGRPIAFEDAWLGFKERYWESTKVVWLQGAIFFLPLVIGGFFIAGGLFMAKAQDNDLLVLLGILSAGILMIGWIVYFFYLGSVMLLIFPIVIDRRLNFWDAFRLSRQAAHTDFWRFLLFYFLCVVISGSGGYLFTVGLLITWPMLFLFTAASYQTLFGIKKNC